MEQLRILVKHFKDAQPEQSWPRPTEEMIVHLEETFLPHLLRIVKKDNTLFTEVELFPGMKPEWDGSNELWSKFQMALLYAVLHGNPQEKFGKIIDVVKGILPGGSSQADDITKILDDKETQDSLKEMMDLVMNTRLASLIGEIVQSLEFTDLGISFDDPEALLEMMRNPTGHAGLNEIMDRAKMILEDKIKTGKINQQELARDIETIRAKFQSSFGKYLNEMVTGTEGNTTGNTAEQIMSNHPDARRARMLARLQKKQKLRK